MNSNFKKIGLAAVMAASVLCGCSRKAGNEFVLKANVQGYPNEKIYFCIGDIMGKHIIDSAVVTNGKFELRGVAEEPQHLFMSDMVYSLANYNPAIKGVGIYIEPQVMKFEMQWFAPEEDVRNTKKEYTLTGSATDNENRIFGKMLENAKRNTLADSLMSFIKQYPDSYISASMLDVYEGFVELEQMKESYSHLSEKAKNYTPGKSAAATIAAREAIQPGKPVPQFSRKDINGNTFNMADLKGKVVLIDFWASWCKPCRAGMPHVKELYNKYNKKGLKVLCVSDDDSKPEAWQKAIADDGTGDFIHILRGLKTNTDGSFDRTDDLSEVFTTHVLPTKFLVGADGNFVLTFASDSELDAKLKEIFGF